MHDPAAIGGCGFILLSESGSFNLLPLLAA
jgi:hypothetical protein